MSASVQGRPLVEELRRVGFVEVGAAGRRSYFQYLDATDGERIGASVRMQVLGFGSDGSVYAHEPGILVATGAYMAELEAREPHNAKVGGKPGVKGVYPAWRDPPAPARMVLSELLRSLRERPLG